MASAIPIAWGMEGHKYYQSDAKLNKDVWRIYQGVRQRYGGNIGVEKRERSKRFTGAIVGLGLVNRGVGGRDFMFCSSCLLLTSTAHLSGNNTIATPKYNRNGTPKLQVTQR